MNHHVDELSDGIDEICPLQTSVDTREAGRFGLPNGVIGKIFNGKAYVFPLKIIPISDCSQNH